MRSAVVRLRAWRVEMLVRKVGLHLDERCPVDEVFGLRAGDASIAFDEAAKVTDVSLFRVRPERVVLRVKILAPLFRNDRLVPQPFPVNPVWRCVRFQTARTATTTDFEVLFVRLVSQAAESLVPLGRWYAGFRIDERCEVVSN